MELTIAICDDDKTHVEIIKEYINRTTIDYEPKIIEAYSGEELLELTKNMHIDVIFLDIEMKQLNGIETGKRIREMYEDTMIIFLTGYKNYALEAFQLESFQYIIKPITYEKFCDLIQKICTRFKEKEAYSSINKTFSFKIKEGIVRLKYEDIYYFERQGKKIYVSTQVGNYEFVDTLKSIEESLDKNIFLRCHQGFIVNIDKLSNIKDNQLMLSGIEQSIPISRKYKKDILYALEKKLFY
ncbi:LytTR family DNA-binding domain-containing protein [Proteiniborus sp.]|uniref:LytR/AlgR family response regulator transcription factor n=1 Tax=Proteiniborus sp. TaxID=2079015 RepID=UPI0033173332